MGAPLLPDFGRGGDFDFETTIVAVPAPAPASPARNPTCSDTAAACSQRQQAPRQKLTRSSRQRNNWRREWHTGEELISQIQLASEIIIRFFVLGQKSTGDSRQCDLDGKLQSSPFSAWPWRVATGRRETIKRGWKSTPKDLRVSQNSRRTAPIRMEFVLAKMRPFATITFTRSRCIIVCCREQNTRDGRVRHVLLFWQSLWL